MFLLQLRKPHILRVCVFTFCFAFHSLLSTVSFVFSSSVFYLLCMIFSATLIWFTTMKINEREIRIQLVAHKFMVLLLLLWHSCFFLTLRPAFCCHCNCVKIFHAIPNYFLFSSIFFHFSVVNIFGVLTYFRWNSIYIQPLVNWMEIYPKFSVFIFFRYIFLFTVK